MSDTSYETARFNMVEQQVRPWEVIDARVLEAMESLPREAFVSDEFKGLAYADIEIPLPHGHHMLKPTIVGRMLQALNLKPTDTVLEIGTGSGYVTACLARLADNVISMEIHEDIASQAADNLARLNISNVSVRVGDALELIPPEAPFDVIAVTGSIPDCQQILPRELNDGGRLFMITGEAPVMTAELVTRVKGDIFKQETLFETSVESLDNAPRKPAFVF